MFSLILGTKQGFPFSQLVFKITVEDNKMFQFSEFSFGNAYLQIYATDINVIIIQYILKTNVPKVEFICHINNIAYTKTKGAQGRVYISYMIVLSIATMQGKELWPEIWIPYR